MTYTNYNTVMNGLEYGNKFNNESYSRFNSLIQKAEDRQTNFTEDSDYLDNLLRQFDGEKRKEIIENLIRDRESLNKKMRSEIEYIKEHLRTVNYLNRYKINMVMPFKDLAKLYSNFNHLAVEEEIRSWKDISFLRLKLFDEGLTGGNYEKQQA